ncbi:MAG: glycosyltransferase family 4 protein [Lachnospiraceae bacterium]|nr:glycosyltransferase family 4 protein [Lachnospiraceae bacterium]
MKSKIKFLKITYVHNWAYANRDRREVAAALDLGWDVTVLEPNDSENGDASGYKFVGETTKPVKWKHFPKKINQLVAGVCWAKAAARLEPDIISGHNMLGVYIGLLSNRYRKDHKKAKVVYDAHEYLMGQLVNKSGIVKTVNGLLEKNVIKCADVSIFVNDSIADAVQKDYKLKERPLVIRNVPLMAPEVSEEERISARLELEQKFGDCGNKNFIIMYHGAIMSGRGLRVFIEAVKRMPDICGVIIGYGTDSAIEELKRSLRESDARDRLAYHEAVPQKELWEYIAAADAEMVTIQAINRSYYFSLPNKLLESIQAGTPVIASNFPEIEKMVNRYHIGLTCDPENLDEVCACIEKLKNDPEFRKQCRANAVAVKEELSWETESRKLRQALLQLAE